MKYFYAFLAIASGIIIMVRPDIALPTISTACIIGGLLALLPE